MSATRSARTIRLYVQQDLEPGTSITLDKRASHHLITVLRAGSGDQIDLFNGNGLNYRCNLLEPLKKHQVSIVEACTNDNESPLHTTLAQGIARGDRMDTAIQKAVELGVNCIQPLYTRRSIAKLDSARADRKMEHWRNVVISACEQSGRSVLPQLRAPCSLNNYLESLEENLPVEHRCLLSPDGQRTFASNADNTIDTISVLAGPESGLDADECDAAMATGFEALRMGPRVLRTETAGTAALAVLQLLHGDFR